MATLATFHVDNLVKQAMDLLGNVDLFVNCAGISHVGLITEESNEGWAEILDANLSSTFYCSRAIVPYMIREQKGRILNISSVWGNVGASCEVAYSATKGGINAFTKALAKELAPSGIAVNALACGIIDTPMNQCFSPDEIQEICDEIPAGRMGNPEEVGEMAFLLAQVLFTSPARSSLWMADGSDHLDGSTAQTYARHKAPVPVPV
ncbi:MAG: SDR family NAD(P)-dependent oxidoreductase [Eubacterium sp.]